MILIDSSVWIDFFQTKSSPESQILEKLILDEGDIAVCGLIRQEVLQGIRDDLQFHRIRHLLNQAYYLSLKEPSIFDEAAKIYRSLRHRGLTIRSPGDCLIAAIAIQHQVLLLHKDRDFKTIASHTSLKLF